MDGSDDGDPHTKAKNGGLGQWLSNNFWLMTSKKANMWQDTVSVTFDTKG